MSEKHEYCGECIFCTSVCPECGSSHVRVKYKPTFEYENDTEDQIEISLMDEDVEVDCLDCRKSFEDNESQPDERLHQLIFALRKKLELSGKTIATCRFNKKGSIIIETESVNWVSSEIDPTG